MDNIFGIHERKRWKNINLWQDAIFWKGDHASKHPDLYQHCIKVCKAVQCLEYELAFYTLYLL